MGRRPKRSLSGPKKICPNARPTILAVRPSWIIEADVRNSEARAGSVGRYISVTNGANAESSPRKTTINAT